MPVVERLDDHRFAREHGGWAVCYVACACGHTWVGVCPGADEEALSRPWECPACGEMRGAAVSEQQWHRLREPPAEVVPLRGLP